MNKKFFSLIAIVILYSGCNNIKTNKTVVSQTETASLTLLEDAVPIVYQGHIYIPSYVDSISGNFVFDTGADGLYLDSTFFANNPFRKFKFVKKMLPGAGAGNPQKVIVITDTVSFKFENYSNNLSFIPVFLLKPILGDFADGLFGKKYFSEQILEINYLHEYIRFHNSIDAVDISEYTKISMKKEDNRLLLPTTIQINDTVSIHDYLLLDIGAGGSISITSATANKYNLSATIAQKVPYYTKYGGVSGHSSSFNFRASFVEIGGYKLDEVVMDYSEDKSGAISSRNYAGLLGNNILERFYIIIDFVNNDLYLKPNSDYSNPFSFSKLGFKYVDRNVTMNAWIVTGFYKDSNAELAGLKIDDKIISVNGIDIHQIPYKEQGKFWKETDKVVLIVLRKDEEKIIEFDLKYVL